jgi:glycerophosphoryl diester phosphodiesterase
MTKSRIALTLFALAAMVLSVMNVSWLAPSPKGSLALIAHRGIGQPVDRERVGADGCDARAIRASGHMFIENTNFSMQSALRFGARGLLLDVQATLDGQAVIFRDPTLECRTNGRGRVAQSTLRYLKQLDVGFGYTSDGGRTYPLRTRGYGGMMTVEEVLYPFGHVQLIFHLADARAAEAVVAAFARAQREIGPSHGFIGDAAALARLRQLTPNGWLVDGQASEVCLSGYRLTGWLGIVPDACRNLTLHIPYDGGWTLWGWPYRFIDRMEGREIRYFLSQDPDGALVGLEEADQLGEVPRSYTGMLLIEDMNAVGRAVVY